MLMPAVVRENEMAGTADSVAVLHVTCEILLLAARQTAVPMSVTADEPMTAEIMAPGGVRGEGFGSLRAAGTAVVVFSRIDTGHVFHKVGRRGYLLVEGMGSRRAYGVGGRSLFAAESAAVVVSGGTCAGGLTGRVLVTLFREAVLTGHADPAGLTGNRQIT